MQTDHGQIVAVHQLHQDSGDLQTDVKVGEGHVHLERGESQPALGLPHDQGLVIASRNCRGSYLKKYLCSFSGRCIPIEIFKDLPAQKKCPGHIYQYYT